MFGNSGWAAATIAAVHPTYQLPEHLAAHLTKANLAPAIAQLQSVPDTVVEECFHDCPSSWNISAEDMEAGAKYAIAAKAAVADIIYRSHPTIV